MLCHLSYECKCKGQELNLLLLRLPAGVRLSHRLRERCLPIERKARKQSPNLRSIRDRDDPDSCELTVVRRIRLVDRYVFDPMPSELPREQVQFAFAPNGEYDGVSAAIESTSAGFTSRMNDLCCRKACGKVGADDNVVGDTVNGRQSCEEEYTTIASCQENRHPNGTGGGEERRGGGVSGGSQRRAPRCRRGAGGCIGP